MFYNVYFRSHYYFRSYCFVKRKTRIWAIGWGVRRSEWGCPLAIPIETTLVRARVFLPEGSARDPSTAITRLTSPNHRK